MQALVFNRLHKAFPDTFTSFSRVDHDVFNHCERLAIEHHVFASNDEGCSNDFGAVLCHKQE